MGKPLPAIINDECHPGDRDDNLWVTFNDYNPSETQIEWEQTCFLDKSFYGYYTWPKMIKYSMNKRARYTPNNMPENVAIVYDRFIDKDFIIRATQFMIFDEDKDAIKFDKIRFAMFKVGRVCFLHITVTHHLGSLSQFWSRIYRQFHEATIRINS
jgi:hypothetical protein